MTNANARPPPENPFERQETNVMRKRWSQIHVETPERPAHLRSAAAVRDLRPETRTPLEAHHVTPAR